MVIGSNKKTGWETREEQKNIEGRWCRRIAKLEILLMSTQLGAIYAQKAGTQPTTNNSSTAQDPNLTPEEPMPAGDDGPNDKFDTCTKLHEMVLYICNNL